MSSPGPSRYDLIALPGCGRHRSHQDLSSCRQSLAFLARSSITPNRIPLRPQAAIRRAIQLAGYFGQFGYLSQPPQTACYHTNLQQIRLHIIKKKVRGFIVMCHPNMSGQKGLHSSKWQHPLALHIAYVTCMSKNNHSNFSRMPTCNFVLAIIPAIWRLDFKQNSAEFTTQGPCTCQWKLCIMQESPASYWVFQSNCNRRFNRVTR